MKSPDRRAGWLLVAMAAAIGAVSAITVQRFEPARRAEPPASASVEVAGPADAPSDEANPPAPLGAALSTVASSAAPALDESDLMQRLRSARANDPRLAVELAREGNRRFPTSPDAPERASILIHALADQGLSSQARGEAEDAVNRYPDSSWVREIEVFTGAHRHRNIRVDEQGKLRYVEPPPS